MIKMSRLAFIAAALMIATPAVAFDSSGGFQQHSRGRGPGGFPGFPGGPGGYSPGIPPIVIYPPSGGHGCETCYKPTWTVGQHPNHWPENHGYTEAFNEWDAQDGVGDGLATLPTSRRGLHNKKPTGQVEVDCPPEYPSNNTRRTASISGKPDAGTKGTGSGPSAGGGSGGGKK